MRRVRFAVGIKVELKVWAEKVETGVVDLHTCISEASNPRA